MLSKFTATSIRNAASFAFALAWTSLLAHGRNPAEPGFPAGIRLPDKARGEAAIAALGARLPEVAAFYGKSPQQLREVFRADDTLWVDPSGELFYACPAGCADCAHELPSGDGVIAEIGPTDTGPFNTSEAFLLHSRPGANRVIYLDFDGHTDNTSGNWKDGASAPPYNISPDSSATFSTEERNRIIEIWQRVAEDYSMFEIDVTTEEPVIDDLRKTSSSDARYGIRVCIGGSGNDWYGSNVGGVAFVGSFDSNQDVPCWVFTAGTGNGAKNIAEAASHEVGHTLGLLHDGVEGGAGYYDGHGNWAPIMGVGYYEPITQWSKGEYASPNNTQDDLADMLTQGAVYRPDDHGGTTSTSTVLSADTIPLLAEGVIEKRTDLDFFRIAAAGGSLGITVKPAPQGSNLRIEVKLYDAAGTLLQTATSADTSAGTQQVTLTRSVVVGDYFFSVDGIGNGDPLTTGYSDYASLGQYLVSITGVVPTGATWLPTAAGSYQWNTLANWSINPLPNAAGVTLRINNNIAGSQTINLATSATLGNLFLGDSNGTHGFTVASTGGTLTFDNLAAASGLSKTSGTNDVISAPLALTGVLVVNQSSSGTLSLSGAVSGAGSLTKEGAGTLVLTGAKTYSGSTTVDDGVLRLDSADALPASNLVLSGGGVLGLASGNFSRANGTGVNQVQWTGDGGFAAFGSDRTVSPGTMSWASATLDGNTLILGHATADATLIWSSNLSFAGSPRTMQVDDGSAAIDARISGVLSGGGTFNKTGSGTLELTNANTYTATTSVNDGLLLISNASALPTANLVIGGGILGLGSADLTARTIGTGASQVQWTAGGGFAAFGATRAVKFSATAINWTATNFIGAGRTLILGHATANATLDWQQPVSMNGGSRTVEVGDGSAEIDALMSGVISGGSAANSPFNKTGEGTLAFTAQNTYNGDTIVSAGTLMIGNGGTTGGVSQNSPNITVASGATLAVNRSDTVTQGSNTLKSVISGDGDFAQIGSGTTILTLDNTYTGTTTVSAGTLSLTGNRTSVMGGIVDVLGAGSVLNISGNLPMGAEQLRVGSGTSTTGTINQTAGAVTFTSGNQLTVGTTSTCQGIYNLSGGTFTTASQSNRGVIVGVNANCNGIFNLGGLGEFNVVSGSSLQVPRCENVNAIGSTGLFNQTGGTATISELRIGGNTAANNANQTATLNLSAGTFTATSFTALSGGNSSDSTINISGTADVTLPAFPTVRGTGATATLTFDGGTLRPAAASTAYMGGLDKVFIKAGGVTFNTGFGITITQNLLTDAVSTGGGLTKAGAGRLTLTGNNTYTGGTSLLGGIINVNHSSALGSGTVTVDGGVRMLLGNGINVANSIVLGSNAGAVGNGLIQVADANTATVSGPVSIISGAAAGGHFATLGSGVLNITNVITSSTTVSHRTGTTVFSGGGTGYTAIIAGAGTIRLGANNGIATTAAMSIGNSAAATFDLAGFSQSLTGITKGANAAIIGNSSTATDSTLTITGTSTFAGIIQNVIGSGTRKLNLTVSSGSLTLGGSNTYTGATTVSGGTLALGISNAIADSSPVSIGSATLDAATFGDTMGTLDATGAATINLGNGSTLAFANSSAIDWSGGTLQLTGNFVSGSSIRFGTTSGGLTSAQLTRISAAGFTGFALNSSGYLTATPTFSSWIAGTFANGAVPVNKRSPNDDFDNDGVRNLVEYAIAGQDPTVPKSSIGGFTGNTLSFTKRAGTGGLAYAIQKSTDLGAGDPWTAVSGASHVNTATTVSYTLPAGGPARVFLRLMVSSE